MIHVGDRWSYIEDNSTFKEFNRAIVAKIIHAYCNRLQQKRSLLLKVVEKHTEPHLITDEKLVDIEKTRLTIRKEFDRNATDFPKDRL